MVDSIDSPENIYYDERLGVYLEVCALFVYLIILLIKETITLIYCLSSDLKPLLILSLN